VNEYVVRMLGVSKFFDGVAANDGVDFSLRRGTVHGLLGENGAGKSTLMNMLFGLLRPDSGRIEIEGREVALRSPSDAMGLGLGMVHQHFMLVRNMTVTENIMLGAETARHPLLDYAGIRGRIAGLSERFGLGVDPDARIDQLSVGAQQRVEILSLLHRDARILILDEPTAVLTPGETGELFAMLGALKADGRSVVLITHKLDEVAQVADEVTILRDGRRVGGMETAGGCDKAELCRLMVGRDIEFNFRRRPAKGSSEALRVESLRAADDRRREAVEDLSFSIGEGEILAVAGVDGNGQRELCECLVGLRPATAGRVILGGEDLAGMSAGRIIERRVAYIPEDRQRTGLVMNWDIQRNLILKSFRAAPISGRFFLRRSEIAARAELLIERFGIKAEGGGEAVRKLSGGNQQKVILARELHEDPRLLVACHPTRGLDVGAMEYVRRELVALRDSGVAILLVSADLEEIFQVADRIMVMYRGRSMGILQPSDGVERVGRLMAGVAEGVA